MHIIYDKNDTKQSNNLLVMPTVKTMFEYINSVLRSDNKKFYFWTKPKTGPYAPDYDNYVYRKGGAVVNPFDLFTNKVQIDSVVTAEELEKIESLGIDSKHYYMININGVYGGPYHYDCGKFYDTQNREKSIDLNSATVITIESFIDKMKGIYIPDNKNSKTSAEYAPKNNKLTIESQSLFSLPDKENADSAPCKTIDNTDTTVDKEERKAIYQEFKNNNGSYRDVANKFNKNISEVFQMILEEEQEQKKMKEE